MRCDALFQFPIHESHYVFPGILAEIEVNQILDAPYYVNNAGVFNPMSTSPLLDRAIRPRSLSPLFSVVVRHF